MNKTRTGQGRYGDLPRTRLSRQQGGERYQGHQRSYGTQGQHGTRWNQWGGGTREPTVMGGCPLSEGGMKNGDKREKITAVNTATSVAWEEMGIATSITSGRRDTRGFIRWACQWRGRNTPQWEKVEDMEHHKMDTREGNLRPLGSFAETTNSE